MKHSVVTARQEQGLCQIRLDGTVVTFPCLCTSARNKSFRTFQIKISLRVRQETHTLSFTHTYTLTRARYAPLTLMHTHTHTRMQLVT